MTAIIPIIQIASADPSPGEAASYDVVYQGYEKFENVLNNNRAQVRAYLYKGTPSNNGGNWIVFMQLDRDDPDWAVDGYDQRIKAEEPSLGNGHFNYENDFHSWMDWDTYRIQYDGYYSPYPRDNQDYNVPSTDPSYIEGRDRDGTAISNDKYKGVFHPSNKWWNRRYMESKQWDVTISGTNDCKLKQEFWNGEEDTYGGFMLGGSWHADSPDIGQVKCTVDEMQVSHNPYPWTEEYESYSGIDYLYP